MTDHELLELAAKAAGLTITVNNKTRPGLYTISKPGGPTEFFDPLNDDGDALRLAVKLRFDIEYEGQVVWVNYSQGGITYAVDESLVGDEVLALRRAIVRAAAEIGKVNP